MYKYNYFYIYYTNGAQFWILSIIITIAQCASGIVVISIVEIKTKVSIGHDLLIRSIVHIVQFNWFFFLSYVSVGFPRVH